MLLHNGCQEGKKKNLRKIEVPTDTSTEFELGDTAPDIQRMREEREQREREEAKRLHREVRDRGRPQMEEIQEKETDRP